MAKYVAFLRGMNLGRRRVKNDALRTAFETMDLTEVSPFLASGNVVFATQDQGVPDLGVPDLGVPDLGVDALAARIAAGLAHALGYPVPTFLRTSREVRAIASWAPFPGAVGGKLQVALLADPPSDAARAKVEALSTEADRLTVVGRELYWLPAGNLTDSALDFRAIGEVLGSMTVRTKRTIERISAKYLSP